MSKQFLLLPIEGLNRAYPSHRIGDGQCSILQNAIAKDNKLYTFPGTNRYNSTVLTNPILWAERYYGIKADGSFTKKTFCYSGGSVCMGNDVTGGLTNVLSGLAIDCLPESATIQVSGNSQTYLFTGEEVPYYYDGNDAGQWYKSSIGYNFVQGVVWLDRLWAFTKNSSMLYASKTLYPENFTDSTDAFAVIIGNDKDSFIRRIIVLGDTLFIFKNNGIYYIEGRTPSTFAIRPITDKYGLAAQRAIGKSGTALAFVNEFDKEIYSFGGTETSIQLLSKELKFSTMINHTKVKNICCTEHRGLFRISFQPIEQESENQYNSHEVCYPTNELNTNKQPKWCVSKGANIMCYSLWNRQGDNDELVTGRSDMGYLMYHYRGANWDITPMEIRIRTKDKVYYEGKNTRFNSVIVDGLPFQDLSFTLRWYLNSRILDTTGGSASLPLDGEERTLAAMYFATQTRFNKRIVPLITCSKGNSISLELYSNILNNKFEIYSFILDVDEGSIIRTNLVGG